MKKQNCWEFKNCGREPGGAKVGELCVCSAAITVEGDGINGGQNSGRVCWAVAGTLCKGEIQGSFALKIKNCVECDFYKSVREEEGFRFDLGTSILTDIYSPQQLAQAYEQLHYALEHMKELESKLFCEEKVASVGRLAAGIAHDINTPLSYVMNNLDALSQYADIFKQCLRRYAEIGTLVEANDLQTAKQESIEVDKFSKEQDLEYLLLDTDEMMTQSMNGLCRIRDIVQNLKSFSKVDLSTIHETDINAEIKQTIEIISREFLSKCEVIIELGDIPPVPCNAAQINQVLLSLLLNAQQAIYEEGTITVRTLAVDDHIVICISDSGVGIKADQLTKVFDPFFTTREVGQGSGLGLSIARNVISNHGGSIEVESEEGKGSTFTIRLPVALCLTEAI